MVREIRGHGIHCKNCESARGCQPKNPIRRGIQVAVPGKVCPPPDAVLRDIQDLMGKGVFEKEAAREGVQVLGEIALYFVYLTNKLQSIRMWIQTCIQPSLPLDNPLYII